MKRAIDIFLLLTSFSLFAYGFYLVHLRSRPIIVQASNHEVIASNPRLTIPRLDIDLPVYESEIVNGSWQTIDHGVSYLKSSAQIGSLGNVVMYGHNWQALLARLTEIKPGDEILLSSRGITYIYIVELTAVVTPDQTHFTQSTGDYRLTLYTCAGFLDTKRFVVTAIKQD